MSRNKQKAPDPPGKPKAVEGMPRDEILELAKSHREVAVDIRRRNHRMQWMAVTSNVPVTPNELLTFAEWLKERCGGGDFRLEVTDPTTHRLLCPPWLEHIEGAEKIYDPRSGESYDPTQRAPDSRRHQHWTGRSDPRDDPRSFSAYRSDEVAMTTVRRLETELRSEREGRERDRRSFESRITGIQEQMERDRRERDERERELERQRFEERLKSMETKGSAIDWSALAPALATVVGSVMTSQTTRATASAEAQARQAEESTKLIVASLSRKDETLPQLMAFMGTLAPLAKPILDRMLSANSPKEKAEVVELMGQQILSMAGMTAQFVQTMAEQGGNDPPWLPFVHELSGGIERIASAFVDRQDRGGGEMHVQSTAHDPPPQQRRQPPPRQQTAPPERPRRAQAPPDDASPEQRTDLIMEQLPPYLHTEKWREFVYYIGLEQRDNVDAIAEDLVTYLMELAREEQLPEEIVLMLQDPRQIGPLFLELLPVEDDYKRAVFESLIEQVRQQAVKNAPAGNGTAATVNTPEGPAVNVEEEIARAR